MKTFLKIVLLVIVVAIAAVLFVCAVGAHVKNEVREQYESTHDDKLPTYNG